jgi:hypothetical protein
MINALAYAEPQRDILAAVAGTSCGVRADGITRSEVEALLAKLEASNPTPEPAISAGMDGDWAVAYTDAPPPSNGVLGPFTGRAFQNIDLQAGEYENLLKARHPRDHCHLYSTPNSIDHIYFNLLCV